MKNVQLLIPILFFIIISLNSFSQTTMEEYNYVTKGYQIQIESGLDMKKGYEIEFIDSMSNGDRFTELKSLIRTKDNSRKIAAYMIVYSKNGSPKEYICIPNFKSSEEILKKYWTQLNTSSFGSISSRLQMITYLLSKQLKW
jgi:hypothetical protein